MPTVAGAAPGAGKRVPDANTGDEKEDVVDWWMAGLALALLVGLGARDVGRPGVASAPALLLLRAVGGLGLVAMAALALRAGSPEGAAVAAVAAVPLLAGRPAWRAARGARAARPR